LAIETCPLRNVLTVRVVGLVDKQSESEYIDRYVERSRTSFGMTSRFSAPSARPPQNNAEECGALAQIIDRIGDKWTVMVLGHLSEGTHRFNELMRVIPGISHRMLTLTLRGAECDWLGSAYRLRNGTTPCRLCPHAVRPHAERTHFYVGGLGAQPSRRDRAGSSALRSLALYDCEGLTVHIVVFQRLY
jgi:hypothetical protein